MRADLGLALAGLDRCGADSELTGLDLGLPWANLGLIGARLTLT